MSNKPKLAPAADYQARDITDWNVTTFLTFITETTREKYGVEYSPGGGGSKQARWGRERGMLKNAQGKYGNRVLKAFIEICWREYRTSKPELYPYPSITFCVSYMDRYFTEAVSKIAKEERVKKINQESKLTNENLSDWF